MSEVWGEPILHINSQPLLDTLGTLILSSLTPPKHTDHTGYPPHCRQPTGAYSTPSALGEGQEQASLCKRPNYTAALAHTSPEPHWHTETGNRIIQELI